MVSQNRYCKAFFIFISTLIFLLTAQTPLYAGIVTTTDIVEAQTHEINREKLSALLSRDDVRQALEAQGVDAANAQQRVNSMTNTEIQQLAANMDQLPAGGNLSTIEWLLIIIIIIILI